MTYTAVVSDPNGGDTVTVSWSVLNEQGLEIATGVGAEFDFAAPGAGDYQVIATATDETDQSDSRTASLTAGMIGISGNDLYIAGTDQRDVIKVFKYGRDRVQVYRNGRFMGRFNNFAGEIHINAFGGNDYIFVSHRIKYTTWIDGGDGNDWIMGGYGVDHIFGGKGNDWISGRKGNDWLYGGAGHDVLFGGRGNDHLFGGAGNDWLFGGRGSDDLDGGSGNDSCY